MDQSVSPLMLMMIGLIVVLALAVHGVFTNDPLYGSDLVVQVTAAELSLN